MSLEITSMAYFGNPSIGASSAATANIVFTKFTATDSGTVTSISYYVAAASGTVACAAAIYSDSAGVPLNKLAEDTGNQTATTTPGWVTINISLAITKGTTYWLARWTDASANVYWNNGATDQYYVQGAVFETWPDPEAGTGTKFARAVSIYATFVPPVSSSPSSWVTM